MELANSSDNTAHTLADSLRNTSPQDDKWIFGGLQQVGLGVKDNAHVWKFYREVLGFDIPMFDETGTADIMAPYMGNKSWERHAVFAINLNGGGGMEIWQYTSRLPKIMPYEIALDNLGILSTYIRCKNIHQKRTELLEKNIEVSHPCYAPDGSLRCFLRDPEYNWVCLVEDNFGWFIAQEKKDAQKHSPYIGGVCGALIGVSDMDKSIEFYSKVCGYDMVKYDYTDTFCDLNIFLKNQNTRRVGLHRSTSSKGIFAHLLTESFIELVETKESRGPHIFLDRYWGDSGFIHLCFDVRGMDALKLECEGHGHPFTIDTGEEFAMDDASGRFAYLEDPDGTLIEFVEVYKMPLLKKYKISLDIKKKHFGSKLPKFILKTLSLRRIKSTIKIQRKK